MVAASFVKRPAGGWVESVLTRETQRLAVWFPDLPLAPPLDTEDFFTLRSSKSSFEEPSLGKQSKPPGRSAQK